MNQHAILYSGILVEVLLEEGYRMRGHVLSTELNLFYWFFNDFWDVSYRFVSFVSSHSLSGYAVW